MSQELEATAYMLAQIRYRVKQLRQQGQCTLANQYDKQLAQLEAEHSRLLREKWEKEDALYRRPT